MTLGAALQRAVIRDTVTGATVAAIRPPRPFDTFVQATAAADDRTFVLAAQNISSSALVPCGPTRLFLYRFNPADRQVVPTPLPVPEFPATSQVDAIALSPDGTRLAVAFEPGQNCSSGGPVPLASPGAVKSHEARREEISVYFLPSGTVKTWQSPPAWGSAGLAGQNAMSWATDGTLAINYPGPEGGTPGQGLRLLNTNIAAGSLLSDSRAVSGYAPPGRRASQQISPALRPHWTWTGYGVLTPDGRTVVAPIQRTQRRAGGTGAAFAEFSASTGKLVRVLWPEPVAHLAGLVPDYSVVWTNASGSVLVVQAPDTRGGKAGAEPVYGVLRGHRFTPIAGARSLGALTLFSDTVIVF